MVKFQNPNTTYAIYISENTIQDALMSLMTTSTKLSPPFCTMIAATVQRAGPTAHSASLAFCSFIF
jgi:hypothetical protein